MNRLFARTALARGGLCLLLGLAAGIVSAAGVTAAGASASGASPNVASPNVAAAPSSPPVSSPSTAVRLESLTFSPAGVQAGGTVHLTFKLSAPAPAGGVSVSLSSSSKHLRLPAKLKIPAGVRQLGFTLNVAPAPVAAATVAKPATPGGAPLPKSITGSATESITVTGTCAGARLQTKLAIETPRGHS